MKPTEEIWRDYHTRLFAFIKNRVADNEAEDILQNVFVKVHTQINSLKENTKLGSWLYQITKNAVIDYYRSKRSSEKLPDWIEQSHADEDELIRQEFSTCLTPMIKRLPEKYRLAIVHSEIERKTQKELAERAQISLSGAKSRVQRGRRLLKSMLHDCCRIEINQKKQLVSFEQKKQDCKFC